MISTRVPCLAVCLERYSTPLMVTLGFFFFVLLILLYFYFLFDEECYGGIQIESSPIFSNLNSARLEFFKSNLSFFWLELDFIVKLDNV